MNPGESHSGIDCIIFIPQFFIDEQKLEIKRKGAFRTNLNVNFNISFSKLFIYLSLPFSNI